MDAKMESELKSILCTSMDVAYEYGKTQKNGMTQVKYDEVINTLLDDLVEDMDFFIKKHCL